MLQEYVREVVGRGGPTTTTTTIATTSTTTTTTTTPATTTTTSSSTVGLGLGFRVFHDWRAAGVAWTIRKEYVVYECNTVRNPKNNIYDIPRNSNIP